MLKKIILPIAILSFAAYAEDTAEINKTSKDVEIKAEKKTDKADELITNRRFRASNGSLSSLSMNTSITYNGGSLEKPFAADRPNISNAGDTTSIAGMSGTVNASYRLNTLNRINLGAGMQMLAPFNNSIDTKDPRAEEEFDKNQGELDVSNPYLSYTHMNKFFGVQTIMSAGITQYTADNLVDYGYQNSVDLSVNTMYNFGGSAFSIGVLGVYSKYFFNKDDEDLQAAQNDVVWGFLPQAEYVINDTFNLRTIVRSNWYQNSKADQEFSQRPITQSVGLGISVNRDIFLYPNLQFVVENAQASNTNIGLSANINMF
tara:strand:+ start:3886 stop:4836 length:951 start_codon:yes stop_codon:yes gene_type:complete